MKIGILIIPLIALLAGCSTMGGYVGEEGVGLQMKESKPKPTGYTADTTHTRDLVPPEKPDTNPSWNVF